LTMSLLNTAQVEKSPAAHKPIARAKRPIPSFVFSPIRQVANPTPVHLYIPSRPNETSADPFVQAVVYHY